MLATLRAQLPTVTPPDRYGWEIIQSDPLAALREARDQYTAFTALAQRFAAAGWSVAVEDDDHLPWLVVNQPAGMDDLDAFEQAHELAGDLVDEFSGLAEF